jgi:hypothetical protein
MHWNRQCGPGAGKAVMRGLKWIERYRLINVGCNNGTSSTHIVMWSCREGGRPTNVRCVPSRKSENALVATLPSPVTRLQMLGMAFQGQTRPTPLPIEERTGRSFESAVELTRTTASCLGFDSNFSITLSIAQRHWMRRLTRGILAVNIARI